MVLDHVSIDLSALSSADHLPLCSFGPGGAYIVDWHVLDRDHQAERRIFPPRTLGWAIRRLAALLGADLKGWLLAVHPGRAYHLADRNSGPS